MYVRVLFPKYNVCSFKILVSWVLNNNEVFLRCKGNGKVWKIVEIFEANSFFQLLEKTGS